MRQPFCYAQVVRNLGKQAFLVTLLVAGCGSPNSQAPIHTAAVTFDPKSGKYQLSKVDLTTISDLATLQGSVANVVGGAEVVIDESDPALGSALASNDVQAVHDLVLKDPGGAVRASFVTSGDTQYPADFHSENMVTTYYNMERSFTFYHSLGWTQDQAGTPTVFYFPSFVDTSVSKTPMSDNAAFFSLIGGFMILPFNQFQDIPLPMNLGIIGHEYWHFTVNTRLYDRDPLPAPLVGWSEGATKVLKSFDEGTADLMGTGVTCQGNFDACDPEFIKASISIAATDRALETTHCLDSALNGQLEGEPADQFLGEGAEYKVGTVLASAIWKAAQISGGGHALEEAFQAVYDAVDDPGTNGTGIKQKLTQIGANQSYDQIRVDSLIANMVVYHTSDPVLKSALCGTFFDRLGPLETKTQPLYSGLTGPQYCAEQCSDPTASPPPLNIGGDVSTTASCLCACQGVTPQSVQDCSIVQ